jgi:hypothetical protein
VEQRGALITGMELSLYTINRLGVYMESYSQLPPSPASRNFHKALVALYAHILRFLAQAIEFQRKRDLLGIVKAMWNSDVLLQFEQECHRLCTKAGEESRLCDSEVAAQWRKQMDERLESLEIIHNIDESLNMLHDKVDLAKLVTAEEAKYNSASEGDMASCLPETRIDLLVTINNWALGSEGERIFWLCGKAGTGKSTIARTVAKKLDDQGYLGASFFFNRGKEERSHAKLLFPTVARQLADLFPEVGRGVACALFNDSFASHAHLIPQFEKLVLEPLSGIKSTSMPSTGLVLVIDALDECDNSESIKMILNLLSTIEKITSVRLRIFVTSRPELPVELGFRNMREDLHCDVRLEEAQQPTIEHDIRVFYDTRFSEIRGNNMTDELDPDWPGEENVKSLAQMAVPLFIYAFTATRFISENPRKNMDLMLRQNRDRSLTGLKSTYLPILQQLTASEEDGGHESRVQDFKTIVGTTVLLHNPLSASALAQLLEVHIGDVGRTLQMFRSVLNIPQNADGRMNRTEPITLFHLSFRDFLVGQDQKINNLFWINAGERHWSLGLACIRLLESGVLKEDLCETKAFGTRRLALQNSAVDAYIPEAVAYACRHWIQHFVESGELVKDGDAVLRFLEKHLLHWMEAMSWLGRASEIEENVNALKATVDVSYIHVLNARFQHSVLTYYLQADEGKDILAILDDASSFAHHNFYIINLAPLQTYMSSVLFAPSSSKVRQMFVGALDRYFEQLPYVFQYWDKSLQRLKGHDAWVAGVAISSDGKMVATGSRDRTVRLWDVAKAQELAKFKGDQIFISAVAISPDGKTVASGSMDAVIVLWDVATGAEIRTLKGHKLAVLSLAFSPFGETLASGSWDNTVRLWNWATGEELQKQEVSVDVTKIVFSSDGSCLKTNIGQLNLGIASGARQDSTAISKDSIVQKGCWLVWRGEEFLWLPHKYRGICYDALGSSVVIGQDAGGVSFITFK